MSNQTGLSDHKRYEAFTGKWRSSVLKEAEKWCSEEQAAQLLAEAVLAEFRNKYANIDPPLNPEYPLRAQVCLVYSQTGRSIRKLRDYIAMQETAAEAYTAKEAPAPEAQTPPAVQPEPSPEAQSEAVPAPPVGPAAAPEPVQASELVPVKNEAPAPAAPSGTQAGVPAAESAPEKKNDAPPDTFFDPVRTTLWSPDSSHSSHVVKELEIPDEEEDGRSVLLSFVNTVLFVLTAGAFGFCFYETGFLQYLMQ